MTTQLYTIRDIANTNEMRTLYRGMSQDKREDNVSQWTRQTPGLGDVARANNVKLFTADQVRLVIEYAKGKKERMSQRAEKAAETKRREQTEKKVAQKLKFGAATAFVRQHPKLKAAEVVALAKKAGLTVTQQLVWTTRYQEARKPRPPSPTLAQADARNAANDIVLADIAEDVDDVEKAVGTVAVRVDKLDAKINHLTALVQTLVDELAPTQPRIGKPIDGQPVSLSTGVGSL